MDSAAQTSTLSAMAESLLGLTGSPAPIGVSVGNVPQTPVSGAPVTAPLGVPVGQVDIPRVVFNLVLKGIDPDEIVATVGIPKAQVDRILLSEWFENETRTKAKESSNDPDSLRELMRARAFVGVIKLGALISSKSENIQLQAIKLALTYSLKPMNLVDAQMSKGLPGLSAIEKEATEIKQWLSRNPTK